MDISKLDGVDVSSVTNVEEKTTDGSVTRVKVTIDHSFGVLSNLKTFTFSVDQDAEAVCYEGMEMRKGTGWTFSEKELLTMRGAKNKAQEVAEQRLELNDVLRDRRPDAVEVES